MPAPRNPRFFGRETILKDIDNSIGKAASREGLRSLALYGLGGVGKTQIALAYAHQVKDSFEAVLWVNSETDLALSASISQIARELELPGITAQSADNENRVLVLSWLQSTTAAWLLVFDNAEEPSLLREFWPDSEHGSILVTSRNHILALDPASSGIDIQTFDIATGTDFLFHVLSSQRHEDPDQKEKESGQALSEKLQGHALALNQMAALILHQQCSVHDFVMMYDERAREMHREGRPGGKHPSYQHFLATVWKVSFDTLQAAEHRAAFAALGILCFCAPDSIPLMLFEARVGEIPDLDTCRDKFGFV